MSAVSNFAYRPPDQLKLTGACSAASWERFIDQWNNYEIAMELQNQSSEKRAAILLTRVGGDAIDVFRTFELSDTDRKDIDKVIEAFRAYCIGTVNVTYERYLFYKRSQESGERFDNFVGDLRRLAKTCEFGNVQESMIRDQIVVGIRDDATRQKLLQVRKLTLKNAIDMCRACELASRQLKEMTLSDGDDVHAATAKDRLPRRQHRNPDSKSGKARVQQRDKSVGNKNVGSDRGGGDRKCRYCGRQHGRKDCPAFGKTCKACGKRNHFEAVCRSTPRGDVHKLDDGSDDDYEALTLIDDVTVGRYELLSTSGDKCKRWYTEALSIDGRNVKFLIDCGATVNLIPYKLIAEIGRIAEISPASTKIRMFDRSELKIAGVIRLPIADKVKGQCKLFDFYVADMHEQAVLGIDACRQLELISVNTAYVHAVRIESEVGLPSCMTERDVIAAFPSVFGGGVGRLEGEIHLDVDDSVPPVQMPLRRIPFSVRDKVKVELERLQKAGIIEPVNKPTKWVSPLLVVPKANGSVHGSETTE